MVSPNSSFLSYFDILKMERPCESTVGTTVQPKEKKSNEVACESTLSSEGGSFEGVEKACNGNGAFATSTPPCSVQSRRNPRKIHDLELEGWEMVCAVVFVLLLI